VEILVIQLLCLLANIPVLVLSIVSDAIPIQLLCLLALILAVVIPILLNYRVVRTHVFFLVLFGLSGIPDMLATVQYAYLNPQVEGNPLVKIFLSLPYLMVLGVFLWTVFWISVAEFAERKFGGNIPRIILFCLFLGHAWGFSTWLPYLEITSIQFILLATIITILILYALTKIYDKRKKNEQ